LPIPTPVATTPDTFDMAKPLPPARTCRAFYRFAWLLWNFVPALHTTLPVLLYPSSTYVTPNTPLLPLPHTTPPLPRLFVYCTAARVPPPYTPRQHTVSAHHTTSTLAAHAAFYAYICRFRFLRYRAHPPLPRGAHTARLLPVWQRHFLRTFPLGGGCFAMRSQRTTLTFRPGIPTLALHRVRHRLTSSTSVSLTTFTVAATPQHFTRSARTRRARRRPAAYAHTRGIYDIAAAGVWYAAHAPAIISGASHIRYARACPTAYRAPGVTSAPFIS